MIKQTKWIASGQYVGTELTNIAHCTAIKGKTLKEDAENIQTARDNAKRIAHCVNLHEELIMALQIEHDAATLGSEAFIIKWGEKYRGQNSPARKKLRLELLAKAGAL